MCGLFYYLEHNMPVPSSITDLSTNPTANSPQGSESAKGTVDDYFRAGFAFVAQLRDLVGGATVSLPSATTVSIGAAASLNVSITGVSTIYAFDTAAEGALRWVAFTGSLTLVHNAAALQLPGSANIGTAAGDTALFKSLGGGIWKCIVYQRASGVAIIPALPLSGGNLSGSIIFDNAKGIFGRDTGGGLHQIVNVGPDNNVNFLNGPGGYWRLYNTAGTKVVLQVDDGGTISTPAGLLLDNAASLSSRDTGGTVRQLTYMAGNTVVNRVAGGTSIAWYDQAGSTPLASLTNTGTFTAITVFQTSDERKKKHWQRVPGDFIAKLAGIRKSGLFHWKKGGGQSLGVGAQSLEQILPQAVHTDEKGAKTVNYGAFAGVAVVELARAVVDLQARIAKLEPR
jgi:hypothetical protein